MLFVKQENGLVNVPVGHWRAEFCTYAYVIANGLEIHWLTRHPWPTEITMDKGREFAREVSETLENKYGVKRKIITSRNPQSNSMIERCHKTLHNMIRSAQIKDKRDLDSLLGFKGVLAACQKAMNHAVQTAARATPTQLVFGRDAMLNATFQADCGNSLKNESSGLSLKTMSVKMLNASHMRTTQAMW